MEPTNDDIEKRILVLRGKRVLLDRDLADLYEVPNIALRQQVKRNRERFPSDFLFQLSPREAALMVSQTVIPSKRSLGGSLPLAFTQEGVAMLSGVLRSKRAVQINIEIMRTFVRLRELSSRHKDLAQRLDALEMRYEGRFRLVFKAIRQLAAPPKKKRPAIGFKP